MPKKPPAAPLSVAELVAVAGKATLAAHLRKRVLASFEQRPETLEALQAKAGELPQDTVADPFVAALRRICHPSSRLRGKHRRAIAEVGSEPHGFVALVIEEARTFSFRQLDPAPLHDLAPWLEVWQERQGTPAATELFRRAACCRLFLSTLAAVFGAGSRNLGTLAEKTKELVEHHDYIDFESGLAFVFLIGASKPEAAQGLLELLDDKPRQGEELVLLLLCRAWVEGFLIDDIPAGKRHLEASLAAMGEDCDPWLELLLRLHLANLIAVTVESAFPSLEDRLVARMEEKVDRPQLINPLHEAFDRHWEDLQREKENFAPALEHLRLAESLVDELASVESKIQFLSLRSRLLVPIDPVQALEDLLDAILIVQTLPHDDRLESMMPTALFVKSRCDAASILEIPRLATTLMRYDLIVTPYLSKSIAKLEKQEASGKPGSLGKATPSKRFPKAH